MDSDRIVMLNRETWSSWYENRKEPERGQFSQYICLPNSEEGSGYIDLDQACFSVVRREIQSGL